MALWLGERRIEKAYLGTAPIRQIAHGGGALWADVEGDYINAAPPTEMRAAWSSASAGDNRLVAVSNGDGGRVFARTKANELPIIGARRVENLIGSYQVSTWSATKSGADAVVPIRTDNYLTDPVYGVCSRIQFDRGAGAGQYAVVYKQTVATGRRRIGVSMWCKLNTGTSAIFAFGGALLLGGLKTATNQWQLLSFAQNATGNYAFCLYVQNAAGMPQTMDLLLATNDSYGPQLEVLSDELVPRPYAAPAVSYGFGTPAVRYLPQKPAIPLDFTLAGTTFYDFFARADTTDVDGPGTAPVGSLPWSMRGPYAGVSGQPPQALGRISSQRLVVDPPATAAVRATYAYQHLRGRVRRIGAAISYVVNTVNVGGNGFIWTLAIGPQDPIIASMMHFRGSHQLWFLDLWLLGGEVVTIGQGTFPIPIQYNGRPYYFEALINDAEDQVTLTVPGDRIIIKDPRITQVVGNWCFWEHWVGGLSGNLMRYDGVWATEVGQTPLAPGDYAEMQPRHLVPWLRPLPALTQAMLWTADLTNAAWTKTGATATAQTTLTQKLAAQQPAKLAEDTSTGLHGCSQATGIAAVQQTVTAIVKGVERTRVRLRLANATNGDVASAIFELVAAGTVVSGAGVVDETLKDDTFIVSVTGTPTVAGSVVYLELVSTGTTVSYAGTVGSGVYVYFVGAEPGKAFTAPIATAGTALARLADLPSLGAVAHGTGWTWLAEVLVPASGLVGGERLIGTTEAADVAILRLSADGKAQAYNGSTVLETAAGLLPAGRHKIAVRRSAGNGAIFLDGVKRVDTAYTFGLPASPTAAVGAEPDGSGQGGAQVLRSRFFATALTDADLVAKTAT